MEEHLGEAEWIGHYDFVERACSTVNADVTPYLDIPDGM